MIELSNGHKLEYLAASGALGFDGKGYWWEYPFKVLNMFDISLFTPVTKTLTYLPERGNLKILDPCVRFVKDGVLNAMGLPNPGLKMWINKNRDFDGIISIYPNHCNDYILRCMLRELNKLDNIKAVEMNLFCPNLKTDKYIFDFEGHTIEWCLRIAKENTHLPIILKLSVTNRIENIFPNIEKYIEAISINSVPWKFVYPYIASPFESLGGGALSGKIIQPYTWKLIKNLLNITDVPVIGCSIWDYEDIERLILMGCKAISFGSIFLRYPWRPTEFVRKMTKKSSSKTFETTKIIENN